MIEVYETSLQPWLQEKHRETQSKLLQKRNQMLSQNRTQRIQTHSKYIKSKLDEESGSARDLNILATEYNKKYVNKNNLRSDDELVAVIVGDTSIFNKPISPEVLRTQCDYQQDNLLSERIREALRETR